MTASKIGIDSSTIRSKASKKPICCPPPRALPSNLAAPEPQKAHPEGLLLAVAERKAATSIAEAPRQRPHPPNDDQRGRLQRHPPGRRDYSRQHCRCPFGHPWPRGLGPDQEGVANRQDTKGVPLCVSPSNRQPKRLTHVDESVCELAVPVHLRRGDHHYARRGAETCEQGTGVDVPGSASTGRILAHARDSQK